MHAGLVAQFIDADPLTWPNTDEFSGSFAPVITWGDGKTSLGTVAADAVPGVFDVEGVHTLRRAHAGRNPQHGLGRGHRRIRVEDDGHELHTGGRWHVHGFDRARPQHQRPRLADRGGQVVHRPTWPHSRSPIPTRPPTASLATIDWGDGSSEDAGTIKEDGDGVFHVSGTHTYLEGDTSGNGGLPYTITVTVLEPVGQTLDPGPNLSAV